MNWVTTLQSLLWAGWTSLLDYLAAHVLLCLLPAFIIAGYMSAMIPKEAITRYLGPRASKWISYPTAAFGGFILAVCSCTILPLFAGIWKRGAGLGPAVTFLFVGPAINILALSYTGAAIGFDIALARLILSIFFGIAIGLLMAWIFRKEEGPSQANTALFSAPATVRPAVWIVFGLLIAILIAGTLQIPALTQTYLTLHFPWQLPPSLLTALERANLTPQGTMLIMLLIIIATLAWKGFETIHERFSGWTVAAILATALTIVLATPIMQGGSLIIGLTGRFFAIIVLLTTVAWVTARAFDRDDLSLWIAETWKFVKQIFPLLILGVFLAGIAKGLIPAAWVQAVAGQNTLWANLTGVLFGVFMYFPTLVEVPVARMFLDLGMARGPLLAYLLADPELSLQSILVLNKVMGRKKTSAYVGLVAFMSTLAGYLFGAILAR
ncbi:MAG: permease [Thermanaerothrix sp.]|nr:permease [Thermanaerothrix sp.]